jgi:hypothetical protein
MDDLLQSAILKVKEKFHMDTGAIQTISTPQPETTIMPILSVFDLPDEETSTKIKFIYDHLLNNGGNPRDQIMSIQTKLGGCGHNENWVSKVYKYCRLNDKANKDLQRYENTKKEMDELSHNR